MTYLNGTQKQNNNNNNNNNTFLIIIRRNNDNNNKIIHRRCIILNYDVSTYLFYLAYFLVSMEILGYLTRL